MAHCTLIARINAGDGKFPFVSVQFSKNQHQHKSRPRVCSFGVPISIYR